jgi:hypothetical protein
VSGAGAGAAWVAACTSAGEDDGAGARGLARVAWRLFGLCIASMSLSENPWRSGMHDGSTKGSLSSKISTSLWYAISPVLGIQTFTRGEVAWQPRKMPHTPRAPLDVSVTCVFYYSWMVLGVFHDNQASGAVKQQLRVKAQPMWLSRRERDQHLVRGHDVAHGHTCTWLLSLTRNAGWCA